MMEQEEVINSERSSHLAFLADREWDIIDNIWKMILRDQSLDRMSAYMKGDEQFGISDLEKINKIGQPEFNSKNSKFKRNTVAFCLGYVGSAYTGYQQQRGEDSIHTVEDDLDILLQRKVIASGRTDKGVSALSQVVSYTTFDSINYELLIQQIQQHPLSLSGHLTVWSCTRVPRKFHPLFSAIWRRYIYLFPLQTGSYVSLDNNNNNIDVDADFINAAFQYIEGKELPYNGFAHRENRATGEGLSDICILYKIRATVLSLSDLLPNTTSTTTTITELSQQQNNKILGIELVGNRFLRRMVRILVVKLYTIIYIYYLYYVLYCHYNVCFYMI
jgi:tRNA pseudouridine(38-40) synthase